MKPKELSIEEAFELLFKIFPKYLDYFEFDLDAFLTYKSIKSYTFYIILRIISILIYLIVILSFIFLEDPLIKAITWIISSSFLFEYFNLDKLIHKKYKYTSYFYSIINRNCRDITISRT